MKRTLLAVVAVMVLLALAALPACGGDGGGGGSSPESACSHFCSCSFASVIPNCQSTCISGINMAPNPSGCAQCTGGSSCSELEANACSGACS